MYGKEFLEWQQAQKIIAAIEAEEPEVRALVEGHYKRPVVQFSPPRSTPFADLQRRQFMENCDGPRWPGLQTALGGLFR